MEVPGYHSSESEITAFKNKIKFYVAHVELTNDLSKLRINIKPRKIDYVWHSGGWRNNWTFVTETIGKKGGKKQATLKTPNNYFDTYQACCDWYDREICDAQQEIKNKINQQIEYFNKLEDEKINIRFKKLQRVLEDE